MKRRALTTIASGSFAMVILLGWRGRLRHRTPSPPI